MSADRTDCCAGWPKPCSYHEGYLDALGELAPTMLEAENARLRAENRATSTAAKITDRANEILSARLVLLEAVAEAAEDYHAGQFWPSLTRLVDALGLCKVSAVLRPRQTGRQA